MKTQSLKQITTRLKADQKKLQAMIKDLSFVDNFKKKSAKLRQKLRSFAKGDIKSFKAFAEAEFLELKKLQKQIPGEIKKLQIFLANHRRTLQNALDAIKRSRLSSTKTKTTAARRTKTTKKKRRGKTVLKTTRKVVRRSPIRKT